LLIPQTISDHSQFLPLQKLAVISPNVKA